MTDWIGEIVGTGRVISLFYAGSATLSLSVETGEIKASFPQDRSLCHELAFDRDKLEEKAEEACSIQDVTLYTRVGQLRAKALSGLQFASLSPGTLSIYDTPTSRLLHLRDAGVSMLTLRPATGYLDFELDSTRHKGTDEIIFPAHSVEMTPGWSICDGRWRVIGDAEFTHFERESASDFDEEAKLVQLAWSLVGGTTVHPVAHRRSDNLRVFKLRKPQRQGRPLISRPRTQEEYGALAPTVLEAILNHLSASDNVAFQAIRSDAWTLLSAKTPNTIEDGVARLFQLLEARDASRSLSWKSTAETLKVDRSTATAIVQVRNDFTHARRTLGGAILAHRDGFADDPVFKGLQSRHLETEFYFALLMLMDAHFCDLFQVRRNGWQYTALLTNIRAAD